MPKHTQKLHSRPEPSIELFIRPQFPPNLTIHELLDNALKKLYKKKLIKPPNAFLAYRMALQKELNIKKLRPTMRDLSLTAAKLWIQEPEYVRAKYNQIVMEARAYFEKIRDEIFPLQIFEYRPNPYPYENGNFYDGSVALKNSPQYFCSPMYYENFEIGTEFTPLINIPESESWLLNTSGMDQYDVTQSYAHEPDLSCVTNDSSWIDSPSNEQLSQRSFPNGSCIFSGLDLQLAVHEESSEINGSNLVSNDQLEQVTLGTEVIQLGKKVERLLSEVQQQFEKTMSSNRCREFVNQGFVALSVPW